MLLSGVLPVDLDWYVWWRVSHVLRVLIVLALLQTALNLSPHHQGASFLLMKMLTCFRK